MSEQNTPINNETEGQDQPGKKPRFLHTFLDPDDPEGSAAAFLEMIQQFESGPKSDPPDACSADGKRV